MIRGLVIGKFLPYHAGHAHLIRIARASVDELTVLVCSIAQEPIAGGDRHRWVSAAHPDCRVIHVAEEVPQTPDEHPGFWPIWVDLIRRYAGDVDVVFTSEDYGDELAARLEARHVCVDRARVVVPVSGTAIRAHPAANWIYIPPAVRPAFVQRVAILGAESTGKSTLTRQLAGIFQTTWVPEYGRTYCEARDPRTLTLEDFDAIGRGQLAMEEAGVMDANKVIFCDTDLHTTCTWSDMIAGSRSSWLDAAARARRYHATFLLGDDVPWVNDGTRVFGERRSEHTRRLRAQLMAAGHHFHELHGSFELRTDAAVRLARALL